jgi:tetratricopeptide (TPR) repeat protein
MDETAVQERKRFLTEMEAYLGRNELRAVLNLAQARLKKMPGDLEARIVICRARLQQGRFDEARDMLSEMEEVLAGFSRIYASMGDICLKRGMEKEADDFYRRFRILSPEEAPVQDILDCLEGLGEKTPEEGSAEEDEVPSDFQTVTLAELYIRQGHLVQARDVLEKIVGNEPQNEKAGLLLGEVRGRIEREAAEKLRQKVAAELSRWLDNIGRLRGHAA